MPDFLGTLKPPRLPQASQPATPVAGQMYYDTTNSQLKWWNGSAWVVAQSGAPSGPAGGDLSGAYPNPTVVKSTGDFTVGGVLTATGGITDGSLPARLRAIGPQITDLNLAVDNGWFWFPGGATNGPAIPSYGIVHVSVLNLPNNLRQTVYSYADDQIWMRRRQDTTWGSWLQTYPVADGGLRPSLGSVSLTVSDANTHTTNGWALCNGGTNLPAGSSGQFLLEMLNWNTGQFGVQTAYGLNDDSMWRRRVYSSTWSAWVQISPPLKTDGGFTVGRDLSINTADGGTKLYFGSALDTNLYRYSADMLRTDDAFSVGVGFPLIINNGGNVSQVQAELSWYGSWRQFRHTIQTLHHGSDNTGNAIDFLLWTTGLPSGADNLPTYRTLRIDGAGKLWIGNALDTNLYRSAAGGQLKTDGSLSAAGLFSTADVIARQGAATQAKLTAIGGFAGLSFGLLDDTTLVRYSAGVLQGGVLRLAGDSGLGASYTSLLITLGSGGGGRWVEVGAPDSGGAGYRMLRVVN